ncbi:MAG: SLC13 family permease, partial [Chloroflexota bacterium]
PMFWAHSRSIVAILLALFATVGIWGGLSELDVYARVAFIMFALAVVGWTLTNINNTYIAIGAALSFSLLGFEEPTRFFESLADSVVWLLIAAFIIAAGVSASGLSERLTVAIVTRAKTVGQLFYLLTFVLILTAFIVPSTSGRAALMLPIFIALGTHIKHRPTVRALSLLFPTVILLSAVASLIGAGAHLVTVDLLWHLGFERISFGRWTALGLPFAVVSSVISVWVLLWLFLDKTARQRAIQISADQLLVNNTLQWSRDEKFVGFLILILVGLWSSESLHGFNNTVVAIVGALIITMPSLGVVRFKRALQDVNWNLILFMAATLKLGEVLLESGAAQWLVTAMFEAVKASLLESTWLTVAIIAAISLLSHLLITSRTARASVIVPLVILFATSLGFSVLPIAFMTTVGLGFCLTLPVSAKPVAMFANADERSYKPKDLLRYSLVLLPIHLVLLLVFAFGVWPAFGLTIERTELAATERPIAPVWSDELEYEVRSFLPFAAWSNEQDEGPLKPAVGDEIILTREIELIPTVEPMPTETPIPTAVPQERGNDREGINGRLEPTRANDADAPLEELDPPADDAEEPGDEGDEGREEPDPPADDAEEPGDEGNDGQEPPESSEPPDSGDETEHRDGSSAEDEEDDAADEESDDDG